MLLSIIVPTKNNDDTIGACLESITGQMSQDMELIVVDNHSTDSTIFVANRYTKNVFVFGPERSAQRNYGAQMCQGSTLLFVDSDMTAESGLLDELVQVYRNQNLSACFIPEKTIATGFWGLCKAFERDFYMFGDLSVEAARAYPRDKFLEIGGFNENISAGEDWDVSDRFIHKYPYIRTTKSLIHKEINFTLIGQLRKRFYYGQTMSSLTKIISQQSHRNKVYPFRPSVAKQWRRFYQQPLLAIGSVFLQFLEILTMMLGRISK